MKLNKILLILLFCVIVIPQISFAQSSDSSFGWETHTYFGEVRQMTLSGGMLWSATSGGIFSYAIASAEYTTRTKSDGLPETGFVSCAAAPDGSVWAVSESGMITIFNEAGEQGETCIIDPKDITVHDMQFQGDCLYLASEYGIIQFNIEKKEVKSVFKNLGSLPESIEVLKILITDTNIWAGTDQGLAAAGLSSPNLQDPQFWTNYSTGTGLPDNSVLSLYELNQAVFAGTKKGLAHFESTAQVFQEDLSFSGKEIYALGQENNTNLIAVTSTGTYRYNGAAADYLGGPWNGTSLLVDNSAGLFAGAAKGGVYRYYNNTWTQILPNGPGGNSFGSMDMDQNGNLWVASGGGGSNGVYKYSGVTWENYTTAQGLIDNNFFSVQVAPDNTKWFGSPGKGLMIIDDSAGLNITHVDHESGELTGSDTPSFVVVGDIQQDSGGRMWLVNSFANNGKALVSVSSGMNWTYFSTTEGLTSVIINKILINGSQAWIGTRENGIDLLDFGSDPANKYDDQWLHFNSTNSILSSNTITAFAADKDNYIWIATSDGLYYYNGSQFKEMSGLLDKNINAIAIDGVNNKWIGTASGLSILDRENFTWTHLNSSNSKLVDDLISSLYIDEEKGIVYAGTGTGLSVITTPYGQQSGNASELDVYPNPFIPGDTVDKATISGLAISSYVRIFTPSGFLVRELRDESNDILGSNAYWDGNDKQGNPVPSGIYVLVSYSDESGAKKGKIALIRR